MYRMRFFSHPIKSDDSLHCYFGFAVKNARHTRQRHPLTLPSDFFTSLTLLCLQISLFFMFYVSWSPAPDGRFSFAFSDCRIFGISFRFLICDDGAWSSFFISAGFRSDKARTATANYSIHWRVLSLSSLATTALSISMLAHTHPIFRGDRFCLSSIFLLNFRRRRSFFSPTDSREKLSILR